MKPWKIIQKLESDNSRLFKESVIEENINDSAVTENEIPMESNEKLEPEFSATDEDSEEDFNQETEEELLDIPTFLRRQAN